MNIQLSDALLFLLPPAVSGVLLLALHWFPWHNGVRDLDRMTAYAVGTVVTVGVPVTAMLVAAAQSLVYGPLFWAMLLLVNTAACGLAVSFAYWVDGQRALSLDDVAEARHAEARS